MAKKITPRLKQLRLDHAAKLGRTISIREVSRETGIAVSTLRRIENNEVAGVDFSTLSKLADFYGVGDIGDLLSLEDARLARLLATRQHITSNRAGGELFPSTT